MMLLQNSQRKQQQQRFFSSSKRTSKYFIFLIFTLISFIIISCDEITTEPKIASLSSTKLVHGATITISGKGFGVKDPVEPLIWDNAEDSYKNIEDNGIVPVDDETYSGYPFRVNINDSMHFATGKSRTQRGVSKTHCIGLIQHGTRIKFNSQLR